MKLEDARETYYDASYTLSTVNRQLCFSGIAIIWVLCIEKQHMEVISKEIAYLFIPFILGLFLDIIQYLYKSIFWGFYSRKMEKENKKTFRIPAWYNWPTIICFYGKVFCAVLGYILLLLYMI